MHDTLTIIQASYQPTYHRLNRLPGSALLERLMVETWEDFGANGSGKHGLNDAWSTDTIHTGQDDWPLAEDEDLNQWTHVEARVVELTVHAREELAIWDAWGPLRGNDGRFLPKPVMNMTDVEAFGFTSLALDPLVVAQGHNGVIIGWGYLDDGEAWVPEWTAGPNDSIWADAFPAFRFHTSR